MDLGRLDRGELLAAAGGVLLAVSLFLAWYSLGNPYTSIRGCRGPHGFHDGATSCTGWSALGLIRILLLIGALAPIILGYIIATGQALAWPRGELTAVVALIALTLIIFRGVIDKPGYPPGEITVAYGWGLSVLAGLMILVGAVWRSQESSRRRKPPGVL